MSVFKKHTCDKITALPRPSSWTMGEGRGKGRWKGRRGREGGGRGRCRGERGKRKEAGGEGKEKGGVSPPNNVELICCITGTVTVFSMCTF